MDFCGPALANSHEMTTLLWVLLGVIVSATAVAGWAAYIQLRPLWRPEVKRDAD